MTKVVFNGRSLSIWGISPVSQEDLVQELADKKSKLSLTVEMKFSRYVATSFIWKSYMVLKKMLCSYYIFFSIWKGPTCLMLFRVL